MWFSEVFIEIFKFECNIIQSSTNIFDARIIIKQSQETLFFECGIIQLGHKRLSFLALHGKDLQPRSLVTFYSLYPKEVGKSCIYCSTEALRTLFI